MPSTDEPGPSSRSSGSKQLPILTSPEAKALIALEEGAPASSAEIAARALLPPVTVMGVLESLVGKELASEVSESGTIALTHRGKRVRRELVLGSKRSTERRHSMISPEMEEETGSKSLQELDEALLELLEEPGD